MDTESAVNSKSFAEFRLHPQLQKAIDDLGFTSCTSIQEKCIPLVQQGQDVAGLAQTGTGKTAAYLIPLMDRILKASSDTEEDQKQAFPDWKSNNFILVLVPTRELVTQVLDNFQQLAQHSSLKGIFLYGGVGYEEQKSALSKPFQFLIATPGRLIDLYKEGFVDLKNVRGLVLDEADRMFDMGFQQDVLYVIKRIPQDRQLLLYSATLNFSVTEMAYQAHSNPVQVDVSRDKVTTENIEDVILHLGKEEKPKFLLSILKKFEPKQVIIFSNFKNNIPRITQFLIDNGYPALGISSLMTQAQRNRVIENFKGENKHNIMVATDVAARGLDIKGVDLVINFELPDDAENYVHRIGRTGRAEQKGKAFSFVSDKDVDALGRIQDYLKEKLETLWLEDTDLIKEFKPFPEEEGRRFSSGPREGGSRHGGGNDRGRNRHRSSGNGPRDRDGKRGSSPRRTERQRPEGDKNQNRDRDNRDRDAQKDSAQPQESNKMHRDRRTGRHGSKDNRSQKSTPQQGGASARKEGQKYDKNRSRYSKNKTTNKNSSTRTSTTAAKASLWGKITSSVKKWVGKK